MSHEHVPGRPCRFGTLKACDAAYAAFQARSQVELARRVVASGRAGPFRRDMTIFGQLVQVVAGDRETITNEDGLPSRQPFTRRLMAAVDALAQKGS